jgi:hypothetical protein
MSSKVNNALFDLIHSLTKSEKRYFKLMSSRHAIGGENNYIVLFDAIDKQTVYDEDKIFKTFKGEAFLNRFSITKKRLYDHILSSLDAFHSINSTEAQLHKMLHSFEILFEKSLYDQSRRILRSAEKLAAKNEMHEILLLIAKKERKLIETEGNELISNERIEQLSVKLSKSIVDVSLLDTVWCVKSQLFVLLSKKGIARNNEEIQAYKAICIPILDEIKIDAESSIEIQYLLFHTLSAYYYAIGDMEKSLEQLELNLLLFEREKGILNIEANKQVSVFTNAIYVADRLGFHKESMKYLVQLKKFANLIEPNEDLTIKLFSSISSIEFSLFIRKGDFSGAQMIAEKVEFQLGQFGDKVTPLRKAFLEFKLAVTAFGSQEYSKALYWVNQILNNAELDKTEDIVGFTQLLDLLIHIELNHDKLLPYSLKSAMRFFKTRNRLYDFEKMFLQFIGKLIKSEDKFEIESLWEELYKDLATITDNTFESIVLEYFDFKSWAESKMTRKSFNTVVQEKYSKSIRSAS